jgi:predicted DNA binding CopG/RHH family protein
MNKKLQFYDQEERELIEAIEKDEFVPVQDQKKEIKRIKSYFDSMPRKDKRVTVRVTKQDLEEIQKRALNHGIPYQTLITVLLHNFAKGKIKISL